VRGLLERELLYVTGKGGAGKTTVAVAAALAAAARGRRTIVVETGGERRVPRLLGAAPAPAGVEQPVAEGLWALTVDPGRALEEWFGHVLRSGPLVRILAQSSALRSFVDAAPGAKELVTIAQAWDLAQSRRWDRRRAGYDLVVVDGPASGHSIGLLRTPRTFADIAVIGPLHAQAARVRDWLEDSRRSGFLAVALPAEVPVEETLELQDRLRRALGRDFGALVVNALRPRRFAPEELAALDERLDGATPLRAAARRAARAQDAEARAGLEHLERLRRAARAPVRTLPLQPGGADVRALAARLVDL
jgi:anion-transporting  ArsA/GET3 family ATPase